METFSCMRFCIVSSNELVVLDSLENSKQYKNEGKRFRVYGALDGIRSYPTQIWLWSITSQRYTAIWGHRKMAAWARNAWSWDSFFYIIF